MKEPQVSKVELTKIADYRGNLSFAEEGKPIPFKIKSVFWTTITGTHTFKSTSHLFLLVLDGNVNINNTINLDEPYLAISSDKGATIELTVKSHDAIILIISDETIDSNDQSLKNEDGLLTMPKDKKSYGIEGYFANAGSTLPFDIKRVYFTYAIPEFAKRGGHAHIYTKEIVFPAKGEVDVIVDDNKKQDNYRLTKMNQGVFLDTGLWRDLENFKDNSTLLVIASEKYFEPDYIRNYRDYIIKSS